MTRTAKQTFIVAGLLIALLAIIKHISRAFPPVSDLAFTAAFLFQVIVPVYLIEREGSTLTSYKLGLLEWKKNIDWSAFRTDLRRLLFLCFLVFPPYWIAFHFWYEAFPGAAIADPEFSWLNFVLTQFLLVALAEEIFYRGFIQTRLLRLWPNQRFLFGIPVGIAIIVTNLFFATGHFVGDYNLGRLGPFLPGFLFSFLAFRSSSIWGAVVFHALCNIFGQLLFVSYFWK